MLRWGFLFFLIYSGFLYGQALPEQVKYETSLMAVVFLSPDCPISQKYMKKLNDLKASYAEKVTFLAAVPGNVSKSQIKDFKKEYDSQLTFESDRDLILVKSLGAKVTPEIFLFDVDRKLVYRGAIDNWFYELGKNRREVTDFYFTDAVNATLRNEKPIVASTEAVGCFIQYPVENHHQHH
jgi:thiol-disulfide isomerase/thioredoxin